MNNRIQELATKADIWCAQNISQGSPAYNILWEHKFAELIVRECAEVASSVVIEHEGVDFELVEKCYKHFGIEE